MQGGTKHLLLLSSKTGEGLGMGVTQFLKNLSQDRFDLLVDLLISKTEHTVLLLLTQPAGSFSIILGLCVMTIAVDLNDQLGPRTEKVENESSNWVLSSEAKFLQFPKT
jgi:hypothetical protein